MKKITLIQKYAENPVRPFRTELELEIDENTFHAHRIGVLAGITKNKDSSVINDYVPDKKDEPDHYGLLDVIERSKDSLIAVTKTLSESGPCTFWYVPYEVKGHPAYLPSLKGKNMDTDCTDVTHEVMLDVYLAEPNFGCDRHLAVKTKTANIPLIDIINGMFESLPWYPASSKEDGNMEKEAKEFFPGLQYLKDSTLDGYEEPGWYLDFYDSVGENTW